MKFAYGYPFLQCPPNPAFLDGDTIGELGQAAEHAGFSAAFFTEHPIPAEKWRQSGGHDALDPFVGLSFCAAATSSISLLTNLTVLPYRNPLMLAKTVASLDVLSGGRVILGIGTGYLKGEYKALGVDFDERNDLFDESVEVLRLGVAGRAFQLRGQAFLGAREHIAARASPAAPSAFLAGRQQQAHPEASSRVGQRLDAHAQPSRPGRPPPFCPP